MRDHGLVRHDFSGPDDLRAMQDLASRLWSPSSRFHPGQLAWSRCSRSVDAHRLDDGEAIALWTEAGEVLGFAWAESPDWLELQLDPARPDVAEEIIDWFEEVSDAETQSALVMEGDVAETALAAAGFAPQEPDEPFFTHHTLDLVDLPPVRTVQGYRFRQVEPHEARARAAVHNASWADVGPSRVDGPSYEQVMAARDYRADLDWVAVDRDDRMVASALVWLDPAQGVGLVEPVGCVPEHRGRGLAGAVTLAALHRLAELGALAAQVSSRGDDGYPGPSRLYRSLGFRPRARTVTWSRSLD